MSATKRHLFETGAVNESAECSDLKSQVFQLRDALTQLLRMPDYDGTQPTSRERLMIKNAARRALRNTEPKKEQA